MRRLAMLVLLFQGGCSALGMRTLREPYEPKMAPDCDPDTSLPMLDVAGSAASAAGAGITGLMMAGVITNKPSPGQTQHDADQQALGATVALGALAVGLVPSAIWGFHKRSGCREAWATWVPAKKRIDDDAKIAAVHQQEAERAARAEQQAEQQRQFDVQAEAANKKRMEYEAAMAAQHEAEAKEAAAHEAQLAPQRAELNALDGFQAARWGMSRSKVKTLFPQAGRSQNKMFYKGVVAGFPATVTFFFTQDQLKSVAVDFTRTNKVGSEEELFDSLWQALDQKYGPSRDAGNALGRGRWWEGAKTTISLLSRLASQNLGSAATINYGSVELHDLIEDVSGKAKKDL